MADNRSIVGSVQVQQDNKERVAYDLMVRISNLEPNSIQKNRRYYFELYNQCRELVTGTSVDYLTVQLKDK